MRPFGGVKDLVIDSVMIYVMTTDESHFWKQTQASDSYGGEATPSTGAIVDVQSQGTLQLLDTKKIGISHLK